MGELKYVLIRLASDPSIHHVVDIYVVDITESYGMFLSHEWSTMLGGYFVTDWSYLLILNKGEN